MKEEEAEKEREREEMAVLIGVFVVCFMTCALTHNPVWPWRIHLGAALEVSFPDCPCGFNKTNWKNRGSKSASCLPMDIKN